MYAGCRNQIANIFVCNKTVYTLGKELILCPTVEAPSPKYYQIYKCYSSRKGEVLRTLVLNQEESKLFTGPFHLKEILWIPKIRTVFNKVNLSGFGPLPMKTQYCQYCRRENTLRHPFW